MPKRPSDKIDPVDLFGQRPRKIKKAINNSQQVAKLKTLAILHASQLVTLAGSNRPRVGAEMSDLAIIRDGGMLIRDGKIDIIGKSKIG
jgi:hypothetical protein